MSNITYKRILANIKQANKTYDYRGKTLLMICQREQAAAYAAGLINYEQYIKLNQAMENENV